MKKPLLLILFVNILLFHSCFYSNGNDDDGNFDPLANSRFEPVILKRAEFENTTNLQSTPKAIVNSGKIYVKGNFIFINEVHQGFHLIENSDPTNPQNIGFLNILGTTDLSIKGDVIYVNNATDLVAFTIDQGLGTLQITKRIENVFPQIISPEGLIFNDLEVDDIIVNWEPIN